MNKIKLIILREFLSRVKKRSFLLITILGPLIMVSFLFLAAWIGASENKDHNVLIIDEGEFIPIKLANKGGTKFYHTNKNISDEAFIESPYSLMVYINSKVIENGKVQLYYKEHPGITTQRYIADQLERAIERFKLERDSIDPQKYLNAKTYINVQPISIKEKEDGSTLQTAKVIVGYGFALLIYLFIFIYGSQVMRGVLEEKTNRIVEIIVSSVKPFQLMMGKIIGIAMVGLTQFLVWIILIIVVSSTTMVFLPDNMSPSKLSEITQTSQGFDLGNPNHNPVFNKGNEVFDIFFNGIQWGTLLPLFILYFLGGYFMYGAIFAAIGAIVDSETDTQQYMIPVALPLFFGFIIARFAIENPDGPAAFWFSLVPLTSPIVMMVRLGMNTVSFWEIALSLFLLFGTFVLTTWVSEKYIVPVSLCKE